MQMFVFVQFSACFGIGDFRQSRLAKPDVGFGFDLPEVEIDQQGIIKSI